ncbi:Bud site selection protein 6 [Smittium mucronatum]|uniref:Bud site selection protein 6 n=1 Tax=Smittium mucronatum TaxID=133383 RepID=A0A1R0GLV6_9FUNG|nr:Bud site selection protein 6 [Smittium mucronatum]
MRSIQAILSRNKSGGPLNQESKEKSHKKSSLFSKSNKSLEKSLKSPSPKTTLSNYQSVEPNSSGLSKTVEINKSSTFPTQNGSRNLNVKKLTLANSGNFSSHSPPNLSSSKLRTNFNSDELDSHLPIVSERTSLTRELNSSRSHVAPIQHSNYQTPHSAKNFSSNSSPKNRIPGNSNFTKISGLSPKEIKPKIESNRPRFEPNVKNYNTPQTSNDPFSKYPVDDSGETYSFKIGDTDYVDDYKQDIFLVPERPPLTKKSNSNVKESFPPTSKPRDDNLERNPSFTKRTNNSVESYNSNSKPSHINLETPLKQSKITPPTKLDTSIPDLYLSSQMLNAPKNSSKKIPDSKAFDIIENNISDHNEFIDTTNTQNIENRPTTARSTLKSPKSSKLSVSSAASSQSKPNNIFFDHSASILNTSPTIPKQNLSEPQYKMTRTHELQSKPLPPIGSSSQNYLRKKKFSDSMLQVNRNGTRKDFVLSDSRISNDSHYSTNKILYRPQLNGKHSPRHSPVSSLGNSHQTAVIRLRNSFSPKIIKKSSSIQLKKISVIPLDKIRSKTFFEQPSKIDHNSKDTIINSPHFDHSNILQTSNNLDSTNNIKLRISHFDYNNSIMAYNRMSGCGSSNTANSADVTFENKDLDQNPDTLDYYTNEPLALENSFEIMAINNNKKTNFSDGYIFDSFLKETSAPVKSLNKIRIKSISPNKSDVLFPIFRNLTLNINENIRHCSLNKVPSRIVLMNLFVENYPEYNLISEVPSPNVYPKFMIWNTNSKSFIPLENYSDISDYSVIRWISQNYPMDVNSAAVEYTDVLNQKNVEMVSQLKIELETIQKQISMLPDKISRKISDFNEASLKRHESLMALKSKEIEDRLENKSATISVPGQSLASQQEFKKLEKQHEKAKNKISRLEAELSYLQSQIDESNLDLEKQKHSFENVNQKLNSEIVTLKANLEKANDQIENLKKSNLENSLVMGSNRLLESKKIMAQEKSNFKNEYNKLGQQIEDLELLINELRKDVVTRGSFPTYKLLDNTRADLTNLQNNGEKLKESIDLAKVEWKKVWELELQGIIEEQKLIKHVSSELDSLLSDSVSLQEMLETIEMKLESKKDSRDYSVGISDEKYSRLMELGGYEDEEDIVYAKSAILDEISRTSIDHEKRLEAIDQSERIRKFDLKSRTTDFQQELTSYVSEHRNNIPNSVENLESDRAKKEKQVLVQMLSSFSKK